MREVTKTFKVYTFDELSKRAQDQAVTNEITMMLEIYSEDESAGTSENLKKAVHKADAMQTPWFTGEYVWEYCKDEILRNLREYYGEGFLEDGSWYGFEDQRED